MSLNTIQTILSIVLILMLAKVLNVNGLLMPHIRFLRNKVKNSKVVLVLTSCIMGCLPIPGRVTMTAPILEQFGRKMRIDKNDLAFIDFWASHHYYLHSPFEKSIIATLAVTGLAYSSFVGGLLPVLFCVLVTGMFMVKSFDVKWTDEIQTGLPFKWELLFIPLVFVVALGCLIAFKGYMCLCLLVVLLILCTYSKYSWEMFKIDWWLPVIIAVIIVITTYIRKNVEIPYTESAIFYLLPIGFAIGLVFGSSSRMATIGMPIVVAVSTPETMLANAVLFYSIEYAGYLLSPAHKCVAIAHRYFHADVKVYYRRIALISLSAVVGGVVSYLMISHQIFY